MTPRIGAVRALSFTRAVRGTEGGVPILTLNPKSTLSNTAPLVYVHGGGFVAGLARATLLTAAIFASSSDSVVHLIDYTLAPRTRWRTIWNQVAAVQVVSAQSDGPRA